MARLARSLETLRAQVNAQWPGRNKANDGWIGDAAHASRASDHNPNSAGVVTAIDITSDPAHGLSARALAEALVASRDSRLKYIISNAQIVSSKVSPWIWRPYSGANAHRAHVHVSVMGDPALYDDARAWAAVTGKPAPTPAPKPVARHTGITATEFGGAGDEQPVAYADVKAGWPNRPGVALPYRFVGVRPLVRVFKGGKPVDCPIVDVGPWYPSARGPADAYWASGTRPRAESDPRTNKAGIDLTPAAARAIGLQGKGLVDWQFIGTQPATKPEPPTKKPSPVPGGKTGVIATISAAVLAAIGWFDAHPIATVAIGAGLIGSIIIGIEVYKRSKS